jgi:isoleucyl-tRNA synthetase
VPVSFMIWTTTPWTLPANLAIAVNPDFIYELVIYELAGRRQSSLVAAELAEDVMRAGGIASFQRRGRLPGRDLAGWTYRHPFIDRRSPVVLADYVILKDEQDQPTGTGLVHTAPGHGAEDYHTGQVNGLEVYSPVAANGTFDDSVPEWLRGKNVWASNKLICERLSAGGHMFRQQEFAHSYPHCWRSKTPTIFRCTEQWFIHVDQSLPATGRSLRHMAREAVNNVQWVPAWGQSRIEGMLDSRPDWCISRQRAWGLPIPAFYDRQHQAVITPEIVRAVAAHFQEHGSDSWFTDPPERILGRCPLPRGLRPAELSKENDIFDVWFESGASWAAVCQAAGWDLPVELYLEGSDQHRGWFQLSLLPALGALHRAPFKAVLTHGFVVDEQGRKMSKSAGNVVDPQQEIAKYGADVMRLWIASVDYQNDVRCSDNLIKSLQDEYRKVRNTIRFMLGGLFDFDAGRDAVRADADSIDAWARGRLHQVIGEVRRLYDAYAFYKVFKQIHDFCNIDLSQVYFVAIKDRLYCDAANSQRRRRTQTVLLEMADQLIRLVAPILVHTAEEAWSYLPPSCREVTSVHLAGLAAADPQAVDPRTLADWDFILQLRDQAMMQLERLKREEGMTNPLDAQAVYHVGGEHKELLLRYGEDPADVLGVGSYRVEAAAGDARVVIEDVREKYKKCARSWKRRADVGQDPEYPDLTPRDAAVVRALRP